MLSTDELIDMLFHDAVERVKAVDVMRDWLCIIEELNPPMTVSEFDGWIHEMKQLMQSCMCDERHATW